MAEAERLDAFLSREKEITRSRAEKLIRAGLVTVDGRVETKPGTKVRQGAAVEAEIPPLQEIEAQPQDIPLSLLYEDADIAVVNKPIGMVVHPAAGNETGTLVNALLYHLEGLSGIGGMLRPGIVHRLDKDTSGILLVAKSDAAHIALSEALKARTIHKTYKAVALGRFKDASGVIEAPVGRHPKDRKRMAVTPDGRYARTEYAVRQELSGAALLDVDLITGRTHQIRVHMAHIGHPLVGDPVYGMKKARIDAPRLMLHAWRIAFAHPVTGEDMALEAPLSEDFCAVVKKLAGGR